MILSCTSEAIRVYVCIHFTPLPTLAPQYTIFPSVPLSVVPDLPLPGPTVSPPHCDHGMMPNRELSYHSVEEHSYYGYTSIANLVHMKL